MDFATNQEIITAARKNLAQSAWDFLVGGTESETTMRRNRLGFDTLALRPRVLVNVAKIDTSTSFLGERLRIPVMTSPIGSLQMYAPDGGRETARAASEFGWIPFLSSLLPPSLEEVAACAPGPKILQLAIRGDLGWCREMVARARSAGYKGLCLTVDVARFGRRERALHNRWQPPSKSTPEQLQERKHARAMTWKTLDGIRAIAGMPLILKGISTAEDAQLAVEHGVDVVYVSNHGGRALDHGRASIDVLPEVVEVVAGRAEVILDGGVTRGTDVVKALALGARAVNIGKLQGWGLAAGGARGLTRVFEILEQELINDMAFLGATRVDQIKPSHVRAAAPVSLPTEFSAFRHLNI